LYADDTSLIITDSDTQRFEKDINTTVIQLNRWFNSNLLLLNLEKTYFLQFLTKNTKATDLHISYANKKIPSIQSTKFLGLLIDNNLLWHCHIDQMIPKLNKAYYVIRSVKQVLSVESLKMVYLSIFHSITLYGMMFWSISTYSKIIFKIQKRVVRIITNSSNKDSCWDLFEKLNILPLQFQYLLTLLMFVVKNKELFKMNSDVHNFSTRSNHDLHLPMANLTVFQNGVWYSGIKVYDHLPANIKQLSNNKSQFKMGLKRFIFKSSFYTLEEF
jgi:hypothetical protein